MRSIMVRYQTAPEHTEANEALVRAVFDELRATAPGGLSYASFRLPDGVSFVHVATHGDPNPLVSTPAFKAFQAGLKQRCVAPPVVTEMSAVGSYSSS